MKYKKCIRNLSGTQGSFTTFNWGNKTVNLSYEFIHKNVMFTNFNELRYQLLCATIASYHHAKTAPLNIHLDLTTRWQCPSTFYTRNSLFQIPKDAKKCFPKVYEIFKVGLWYVCLYAKDTHPCFVCTLAQRYVNNTETISVHEYLTSIPLSRGVM